MDRDNLQSCIIRMLDTRTDWRTRREAVTSAASNFDNLSCDDRLLTRRALGRVLESDASAYVRYEVARVFSLFCNPVVKVAQVGFRDLAPLVSALLNDTSPRVRLAAAEGLELYSENLAIQQVVTLMNNSSLGVRGIEEYVLGLGKTRD
jgi:HEAT repeat protein